MKRHELIFGVFRIPLEAAVVFGAFYAGREIRLVTDLIPGVQLPIQRITESELFLFALSGAALYVAIAFFRGMYRISHDEDWGIEDLFRVVSTSFSWFFYYLALVYLGVGYLYQVEIPRLIIFFALGIVILGVSLARFAFASIRRGLLR